MEAFEWVAPFHPFPKRIDVFLVERLKGELSRVEIQALLKKGAILLNGRPAKPSTPVNEGDIVQGKAWQAPQHLSKLQPEKIALSVLYEDESLLVIDKPAGMVVHPGAGNKKGTLVHALLGRGTALSSGESSGKDRPGIVHRLDKKTSGLLIVAKTNEAHRKLQDQFESRTITKVYTALVSGRVDFEEGHIEDSLARHPKILGKMAVSRREDAKEAFTKYRVLERFAYSTLLTVRILTGRTHQIRVHLAHLGHPVLGDELYGRRESARRLCLHASKIEFSHPKTGKIMSFESPLPAEFEAIIQNEKNKKNRS